MAVVSGTSSLKKYLFSALDLANMKRTAIDKVRVLVVGGGGGGGTNGAGNNIGGGGGGGGGVISDYSYSVSPGQSISVTVGAGGATAQNTVPGNGGNSVFGSLTATGGGRGAGWTSAGYYAAAAGGSGGGGAYANNSSGSGTSGQGYPGGPGTNDPAPGHYGAGGGGGAGGPGRATNVAASIAGDGGPGLFSDIVEPTGYYYSAGGGGGIGNTGVGTTAGQGGYPNYFGIAGDGSRDGNGTLGFFYGNGGGGAGNAMGSPYSNAYGGPGAQGTVIIRYSGPVKAFPPEVLSGDATSSGPPGGYVSHSYITAGSYTFTLAHRNDGQAVTGVPDFGTSTGSPTFTTEYGGGLTFNGSNYFQTNWANYVYLADNSQPYFSEYTIEVVFKSTNVSNYRNILDFNYLDSNNNMGPRLEQNSSGNLGWVTGSSVSNYQGTTVISSGMQNIVYHVTLTKTIDGIARSYLNGNLVTTTNQTHKQDGIFRNVRLGGGFSSSSERFFIGSIYLVKVYLKALSSTEVATNFNSVRSRFGL